MTFHAWGATNSLQVIIEALILANYIHTHVSNTLQSLLTPGLSF